MKILGIETSCDETAAAIIIGKGENVNVLSNIVLSQIKIHKKYGGVVPETAAREHVLNIVPVIDKALEKAGIKRGQADKKIDVIAATIGPGLITSLMVGVETAKILSYVWNIPVVGVNHIEAHIYANLINKQEATGLKKPICFPALILTVSGGHTMLILMNGHGKFQSIGKTRDDAAGEAFDKAARFLKIGYPGGPVIAKYAEKFIAKNLKTFKQSSGRMSQISEIKSKVVLPRPMINSNNFDFSFSGLKTALRYSLEKDSDFLKFQKMDKNQQKKISRYCYEFQQAVIDVLTVKTIKAAQKYKVKTVLLSGGVGSNKELRARLKAAVEEELKGAIFHMPDLKYMTDNAAMVAAAGYFKAMRKEFTPWQKLKADPNLEL